MAEPDIKLEVTADVTQAEAAMQQLEQATEQATDNNAAQSTSDFSNKLKEMTAACKEAASNLEFISFDYFESELEYNKKRVNQLGELKGALNALYAEMARVRGVTEELTGENAELGEKIQNLLQQYASGTMSVQEAEAAYEALNEKLQQHKVEVEEAIKAENSLGKESEDFCVAAMQEVEAYKERQKAAKEEIETILDARAKREELRTLELQSLEELKDATEELTAERERAEKAGDYEQGLNIIKQQEDIIAAYDKKAEANEKANERARAAIEKIEKANRREAASIEELTRELEKLKAAQAAAADTGDVQAEAGYAKAAQETADALERKQAEAERAARALERAAAQAEKEAKAAAKEAAEQEKVDRRMKLATLSMHELTAEMQRLNEERRAASKAGDQEAYNALTAKLADCKRAMAEMKKEANLSKTALMGKAQAGMQVAGQLSGLAKTIRSGNVDIADMISTVMGLGMALQAGLGPIGWAMMAVQGLQMAYSAFGTTAEDVTEKLKKLEEAHKAAVSAADSAAKSGADKALEAHKNEIEAAKKRRDDEIKDNARKLREKQGEIAASERVAAAEEQAKKAAIDAWLQQEEQAADKIAKRNAQEAEEYRAKARAKAQADIAAIDAAAAERQRMNAQIIADEKEKIAQADADAASKAAKAITAELNKQDGLADAIKDAVLPAEGELENLRAKVEELNARKEAFEAYTEKRANDAMWGTALEAGLLPIVGAADAIASSMNDGAETMGAALMRRFDNFRHGEENQKAIEAKLSAEEEKELEMLESKLAAMEDGLEKVRDAAGLEGTSLEAVAAIARQYKEKREELGKEQETAREVLDVKRKERDAAQRAAQNAQEVNKWQEQADQQRRTTEEATRAAAMREAETRRKEADLQEQWHEMSGKSLQEQATWLRRTLGQLEEGSLLWKKYNDALKKTESQMATDELAKIKKELKVSRDYAKKRNKTEEQILREDGQILQQEQRRLMSLLQRGNLDAKARRQIQQELNSVNQQIKGWRSAINDNIKGARKWLREMQPPKIKGRNKTLQKHIDLLSKQYKRAAARAAKYAEKGDTKALARTERYMGNLAKSMGRCSTDAKQAEKMHKNVTAKLRQASGAVTEGGKAEKEATKATKQKAQAQKKAARKVEQATPKPDKAKDATVKVAHAAKQAESAARSVEKLAAEMDGARSGLTKLASAAVKACSMTSALARATNKGLNSMRKELDGCKKAIDRLSRKVK